MLVYIMNYYRAKESLVLLEFEKSSREISANIVDWSIEFSFKLFFSR